MKRSRVFSMRPTALLASVLFSVFFATAAFSQPSATQASLSGLRQTATVEPSELNGRIDAVFGPNSGIKAGSSVRLFRIDYSSLNYSGKMVVVNGLLALPANGAPNGLVIFNHGTTADRDRSPSRYKGQGDFSESEMAMLAFASGGYAVAMPDYLGLGDEKGFHPYPLGEVNSRTAVDMIVPARIAAARMNIRVGRDLFVTGYSEGGAVAMWTARRLEETTGPMYRLTASAPLSGPYDLSETMRKWLVAENTSQEGFIGRLYLLSYMLYSLHKNRGIKLTNYFEPAMALTVSQAFNRNREDKTIITRLAIAAGLMKAGNSIENVLTPRFYKALKEKDLVDPVVAEMAKNDAYDWTPSKPMLLVNLETDAIVDGGNSDVAYRVLRRNAGSIVERFVIKNPELDHMTASAPAILRARMFFDGVRAR
ncbi:MAG: hypothetical protein IPM63_00965 [Acidobacteriota bacterium]|nr:MAG: hypothetical protein IPM63_00965 [Acidobacteriota bacterium]